ncbi:MAG: glutamate racemase [Cytophagales bacterium]|nr:glutamate racemase [Cytophagales bacterium]
MNNQPIGIFDSGLGGLTVLKEIQRLLPGESIVYYADQAFCPYGNKKPEEIKNRSRKIVEQLINKHQCKLIVVACNTATAYSIQHLRASFQLPFVGMEPAIKPAALQTNSGIIGVLATEGTLKSEKYNNTASTFASERQVVIQEGRGLVELVENNCFQGKKASELLEKYLRPMLNQGADHIVLGCTHYPFYKKQIEKIVGKNVLVIDPAPAVARRTKQLLEEKKMLCAKKNPVIHFLSSEQPDAAIRQKALELLNAI